MRIRRGSINGGGVFDAKTMFKEGDVVIPLIASYGSSAFYGMVLDVNPVINKVSVCWNNGFASQHDPDEVLLALAVDPEVRKRLQEVVAARRAAALVSRRGSRIIAKKNPRCPKCGKEIWDKSTIDQRLNWCHNCGLKFDNRKASNPVESVMGNQDLHGIKQPRGGGFSIMQELVKDLHKESIGEQKTAGAGISDSVLYRKIRNALLSTARKISRIYPDAQLNYANRQLSGTVLGHKIRTFYEILRASNGEVAGLPVLIIDGKQYDRFYQPVEEKIKDVIGVTGSERTSSVMFRRGMYHKERGRLYKPTRSEKEQDVFVCPRCKNELKKDKFSRGVKLFQCPQCSWKITSDKLVSE